MNEDLRNNNIKVEDRWNSIYCMNLISNTVFTPSFSIIDFPNTKWKNKDDIWKLIVKTFKKKTTFEELIQVIETKWVSVNKLSNDTVDFDRDKYNVRKRR